MIMHESDKQVGTRRLCWAVLAGKEAYAAAAHVGSAGTRTVSLGGEGKRRVAASLRHLCLCANTSDVPRVLSSFPLLFLVLPRLMFEVFQTSLLLLSPAMLPLCPPPRMQTPELLQQVRYLQVHPQFFSYMPMAPHWPHALCEHSLLQPCAAQRCWAEAGMEGDLGRFLERQPGPAATLLGPLREPGAAHVDTEPNRRKIRKRKSACC